MSDTSVRPSGELAKIVSLRQENAEFKRHLADVQEDRALREQLFNGTRAVATLFERVVESQCAKRVGRCRRLFAFGLNAQQQIAYQSTPLPVDTALQLCVTADTK